MEGRALKSGSKTKVSCGVDDRGQSHILPVKEVIINFTVNYKFGHPLLAIP